MQGAAHAHAFELRAVDARRLVQGHLAAVVGNAVLDHGRVHDVAVRVHVTRATFVARAFQLTRKARAAGAHATAVRRLTF